MKPRTHTDRTAHGLRIHVAYDPNLETYFGCVYLPPWH